MNNIPTIFLFALFFPLICIPIIIIFGKALALFFKPLQSVEAYLSKLQKDHIAIKSIFRANTISTIVCALSFDIYPIKGLIFPETIKISPYESLARGGIYYLLVHSVFSGFLYWKYYRENLDV